MTKICILGMGDCGTEVEKKVVQRNQLTSLNEFLDEKIIKSFAKSATAIENIQNIFAEAEGNVLISDVDMKQYAELTSDTQIDIQDTIEDEKNIDQMIDMLADVNSRTQSELKGLALPSGQVIRTDVENEIITDIKNQFKSLIKKENISSCVANILNRQTINAKAKGNVIIKGIKMDQTASLVSSCYISAIGRIFNKIEIDQEITPKTKAVIEDIAIIEGPIAAIATAKKTGVITIVIIIAILLAVIIPAILIFIFVMFRRPKTPVTSSPKTLEKPQEKVNKLP